MCVGNQCLSTYPLTRGHTIVIINMAAADQEPHVSAVRPRSFQDESYLHGFLGTVDDLQKAGAFQDVVLEVEGRRFPCHRLVLSAASPYFRAMFTSDMAESRQKTVALQGLDAGMFGEILSYIYSGTLHVSLDIVQPLYQAADLLQLDYVRDTCSSYMTMNVDSTTCVDLYNFADIFSLDIVLRCCVEWIDRHFAEFSLTEGFCSLSVIQLTEIISHDELNVKEETTVWEAVVRWVQHSREDRQQYLPSILPHIRFNFLTIDNTTAILDHPLVRKDSASYDIIRSVVQKGNPNLKPRHSMITEMVLLSNDKKREILFMNPRKGKYISCSYGPENPRYFRAMTVTSDNDIYMMDREVCDYHFPLFMFKYNHSENVWEHVGKSSVSSLHGPGYELICYKEHLVEVDRILYYLGLEMKRGSTSMRMKKYNSHTDQWQECSQLQFDRHLSFSAALSCGPNLYFLGTCAEVYHYDWSQDRWCERTPANITWSICTAVAMGTEIFCTNFYFTKTMVYDTESDSWQQLQGWPNSENLRVNGNDTPTLFVLENQLHISLKAYDPAVEVESLGLPGDYLVYVYDRSADAWSDTKATLPESTPMPRSGSSFVCPVARMYLPYLSAQNEGT